MPILARYWLYYPRVDIRPKTSRFHFSSATIGCRLPKIFCLHNVLASTSSCCCLPICGRRQNFYLKADRFGGLRQSGGVSHWQPLSKNNLGAIWRPPPVASASKTGCGNTAIILAVKSRNAFF